MNRTPHLHPSQFTTTTSTSNPGTFSILMSAFTTLEPVVSDAEASILSSMYIDVQPGFRVYSSRKPDPSHSNLHVSKFHERLLQTAKASRSKFKPKSISNPLKNLQMNKQITLRSRNAARRALTLARAVRASLEAEENTVEHQINETEEYLGLLREKQAITQMRKAEAEEQVGMVRDVLDQDGIPEISMSDSGSDDDADDIDPQHYRSFAPEKGFAHLLSDDPQLSDDTNSEVCVHNQSSDPALSSTSSNIHRRSSSDPAIPSTSSTTADTVDLSPQTTVHSSNRSPSPSPSNVKA